jgi:hypothetical protein
MTANTPEEVFRSAQDAMARHDYDAFFQCIDRNDLRRVTNNSMKLFLSLGAGPRMTEFKAVCARHGILPEQIDHIVEQGERIIESARSMPTATDFQMLPPDQLQARLQRSGSHRDLVREYEQLLEAALASVENLALFTAGLERLQRERASSGSVSTNLFVDETLQGVEVTGKTAWARRAGKGWSEDVAFVQRGKRWYIRLVAVKRDIPPPTP